MSDDDDESELSEFEKLVGDKAFFMGRIEFWLGGLSPIFMIPAFRKKFIKGIREFNTN